MWWTTTIISWRNRQLALTTCDMQPVLPCWVTPDVPCQAGPPPPLNESKQLYFSLKNWLNQTELNNAYNLSLKVPHRVLPRFFWVPSVFSRDENSHRQKSWIEENTIWQCFWRLFNKVLWTIYICILESYYCILRWIKCIRSFKKKKLFAVLSLHVHSETFRAKLRWGEVGKPC
jgi:hypothetical protein